MTMTRRRCRERGWIGDDYIIAESKTPTSITVHDKDDRRLLHYLIDGEWWSLWEKDDAGFIRGGGNA